MCHDRIPCCQERICGIVILDRSNTVGHWVKRLMGSKMGKAELRDLPCSGRVAQILKILQHAYAIIDEN